MRIPTTMDAVQLKDVVANNSGLLLFYRIQLDFVMPLSENVVWHSFSDKESRSPYNPISVSFHA